MQPNGLVEVADNGHRGQGLGLGKTQVAISDLGLGPGLLLQVIGRLLDRLATVIESLALAAERGLDEARCAAGPGNGGNIGRVLDNVVGDFAPLGGILGVGPHAGDKGWVLQGDYGTIGDGTAQELLGLIGCADLDGLGDIVALGKGRRDLARMVHIVAIGAGRLDHLGGQVDRRWRRRGWRCCRRRGGRTGANQSHESQGNQT